MIYSFDQVDSTNRIAKELALNKVAPGSVVRAASQSAGKGQHGRSFLSPLGGLYFSLLLQPALPTERLPLITLATGLALQLVLHSRYGLQPQIKWPNDIYLDQRKVAGILCENVCTDPGPPMQTMAVIGVGLNVNSRISDFSQELQSLITTVREQLGRQVDPEPLLAELLATITAQVDLLGSDPQQVLTLWQRHDYLFGRPVRYTNGDTELLGTGLGINACGYYRIRDAAGGEREILGGQLRPHEGCA